MQRQLQSNGVNTLKNMLYIRKLFTQDLRDGKQIAFPKEPSNLFFSFDFSNNEEDRAITFIFRANFEQFQEYEGKVIRTRLYSAGSESRMDGEVKAFIRDVLHSQVNDLLIFKNKGTRFTEFEVMFVPQTNDKYYPLLVTLSGGDNHSVVSIEKDLFDSSYENLPLQQIFYGAPGTGKSHTIKEQTEDKAVIRTTFHPDSDYSTFVGCYKPTTQEETRVTVIGTKAVPVENADKESKIIYQFVSQAFLKAYLGAWEKYTKAQDGKVEPQFLIIEEINRGNCAQIFGDLFQLLDRADNGFSEYPIEADTDLQKVIAKAFSSDGEYQLENNINVDGVVEKYKSNYGKTLSEDLQSGRVLLLPSNLYIWATMNTSDQSLFPIDSAFKRRWDWVYIPIKKSDKDHYKIEIENVLYDWWSFVEQMNKVVESATQSEDKKMGYYFCKPDKVNGVISAKKFVSKVLFYLWNDVFKDNGFDWTLDDVAVFKYKVADDKEDVMTFGNFFQSDGSPDEKTVTYLMKNLKVELADDNEDALDDEEEEDYEDGDDRKNSKSKSKRLSITLDGEVIEEKDSVSTFAKAIEYIGVERVADLDFKIGKVKHPLLSKDKLPDDTKGDYGKNMKQIGDYWLVTKLSNEYKIRILTEIQKKFDLNIEIKSLDE